MKVRELSALLAPADPEAEVLMRLDGSIYPTAPAAETADYNHGNDTAEYFIVTDVDFPVSDK
jgi:hypothetical protein